MAFNLDDYEPVAIRLARFLDANPDGRVITDLVHYTDNRCVFRCDIYKGETLIATGWEEETRGEGHINKTSHLANCETGAVGRALANAGLAGSDPLKRASREEMAKVQRVQAGSMASPTSLATPKQLGFIKKLAKDRGLNDEAMFDDIMERFQHPLESLTAREASQLIEAWK
jgi:hypothetical protein